MKLPKKDQQMLAEAYDQIQQPTPSNITPDLLNKPITPELLNKALQAVRQEGKISTSMLQRVLRVDKAIAL